MRTTASRRLNFHAASSHQRGIALFVGLIFLVVLSLVAVIAMQSTFLEMRMATNVARHEEAFQMSDSMRGVVGPFLDSNFFNGGWPVSWGGSVPDNDFDWQTACGGQTTCAALTMFKTGITDVSNPPKQITGSIDVGEEPYNPSSWVTDLVLTQTNPNGIGNIAAKISVIPDGVTANQGSGTAQAAGYRGLGVSIAGGGFAKFFEVQSVGLSPDDGSNGRAVTIAQYRAVAR